MGFIYPIPKFAFVSFKILFTLYPIEVNKEGQLSKFESGKDRLATKYGEQEMVLQAIMNGLREYLKRTGQKKVVFGLSGGLDSAVTLAIAALAIGPENVVAIMMPSENSSQGSVDDSKRMAKLIGLPEKNLLTLPIQDVFAAEIETLRAGLTASGYDLDKVGTIPYENLQSRSRMIFEMFVANIIPNAIKLNTSNKSEIAMGYSSMYGDSTGAISLLGDLYKTQVRAMGYYINQRQGSEYVPVKILEKAPSAELRKGQVTASEIPDYQFLDPLLIDLVENRFSPEQLRAKYTSQLADSWGPHWVDIVLKRFAQNEWKRNQLPPAVYVSKLGFGFIGRREPTTGWKYQPVQLPAKTCRDLFKEKF